MCRRLIRVSLMLPALVLASCLSSSDSRRQAMDGELGSHDADDVRHIEHDHDHVGGDGGDVHGRELVRAGDDADDKHLAMHPGATDGTVCRCDEARAMHGWCDHCQIGYIALVPIRSALLFETLDPHGHVIGHDSIRCDSCRAAIAADAWCASCEMGWFDGKAYFTRLTHTLAMGRVIAPEQLSCQMCRDHIQIPGWCDACSLGIAGNVAFDQRQTFEQARSHLHVLDAALARVGGCELCACAIVVDGTCPLCHVAYQDGSPVPPRKQQ